MLSNIVPFYKYRPFDFFCFLLLQVKVIIVALDTHDFPQVIYIFKDVYIL